MRARLRSHRPAAEYVHRPVLKPSRQLMQDVNAPVHRSPVQPRPAPPAPIAPRTVATVPAAAPKPQPSPKASLQKALAAPRPVAAPAHQKHAAAAAAAHKPERSKVLMRQAIAQALPAQVEQAKSSQKRFKLKPSRSTVLTTMAVVVFVAGITVSIAGFHTNNVAQAEVKKASQKTDSGAATTTGSDGSAAPSTTPIAQNTLANYHVAADLARYIRIPKIGVYARVLQVGVTSSGALATPSNVFDTAWYTGSAKPGQPGATLIDGHVSSWTSHGVFYNIKNLTAGDSIEIERGDGTKLEYTVAKTVAYDAKHVDMGALMTPVTTGESGLNLITCGGKYDSKSGEFTQRIAVFATLNN